VSQPSAARGAGVIPGVVVVLVLIGLAGATRRAYVLLVPPKSPRFAAAAALDSGFAAHRLLTFVHIAPASLVNILMPLPFIGRVRRLASGSPSGFGEAFRTNVWELRS
jgi:hypothetical protein